MSPAIAFLIMNEVEYLFVEEPFQKLFLFFIFLI